MHVSIRQYAAVVLALAIAACATFGRAAFKEPIVHLRDVRLVGAGLSGATLDVSLSVYNPNGFRLDGTRLTYRVLVDSTQVGNGDINDRFTVQENDSSIVKVPVNFTYAGIGAAGRQLLERGVINYRVMGDITVSTPVGNFVRPYDQTGRFAVGGRE